MADWRRELPFAQRLATWDEDEESLPQLCTDLATILREAPSRELRRLAGELAEAGDMMDSQAVDDVLASIYEAADSDRVFLGVAA
ncbi:MAG: hypothetical protein QOI63_740 [Thermoplasmata archaeon]|jgi:hypothetical protein|nr:hypothetical protein [Thermoplasmata archaeon]